MKDFLDRPSELVQNHAEPVKIWKARRFIEKNSSDELSLTKVARNVGISVGYLSEKFREITGTNFVDYVAQTRFDQACHLLRDGDLRISEIAFAVGFQSLSQFNRVFRRLCGKSPSQYRAAPAKESAAEITQSIGRKNA